MDFSDGHVQPDVNLFPASPREGGGSGDDSPPQELLQAILRAVDQVPGCGVGAVRGAVKGDNTKVDYGREWLIAHGHIRAEKEGNKTAHYIGPVPFAPSGDQEITDQGNP
ncbi:hypothetical protein [Streptomyces sp. NPDC020747]|uniref:hypothetical protein n=1 Tax=Streptomyces sp. NPDC020747 TaxID=3365086 RepID=UPI00379A1207